MRLAKIGIILSLLGFAFFIIIMYLITPYTGSSGAGLAGVPTGIAIMASLGLIGIGVLLILITLIIKGFNKLYSKS